MNPFEELCKLASEERWCWNMYCSTCGHMHFKLAFLALARGESPSDPSWKIHADSSSGSLGEIPRAFDDVQQETLCDICSKADLKVISESCSFPAWLGYLGLVLRYTPSSGPAFYKMHKDWAKQLLTMVPDNSAVSKEMEAIAGGDGYLAFHHLEACERAIRSSRSE